MKVCSLNSLTTSWCT